MYKKALLSIFILIISTNAIFSRAATVECTQAELTMKNFADGQGGPSLSTTSTFVSTIAKVNSLAWIYGGTKAETLIKCTAQSIKKVSQEQGESVNLGSSCDVDEEVCQKAAGLLRNTEAFTDAGARPSGSMLGLGTLMEDALKDPIPLSLAYYVNQNAQKIPGLKNTALAAEPDTQYGGPFLGTVYHYWGIARNIAYAFLAMAMMVIGVMIITRQKIDAKASVTVQQALPQVIIALILITFSYPIGAAGASLAYNIKGNLDSWELITGANKLDVSTVSVIGFWSFIGAFVSGIVAILAGVVAGIISFVMVFSVYLKIFGIYIKMLFATVTAPLAFAVGAIPGNQNTTVNWFKQYGSYLISLPAMSFGYWFVARLIVDVGVKATLNYEEMGGWGFGLLAGVANIGIAAFGFGLVLKIPEKIDAMFGIKGGK